MVSISLFQSQSRQNLIKVKEKTNKSYIWDTADDKVTAWATNVPPWVQNVRDVNK